MSVPSVLQVIFSNPVPWTILAGFFVGAALNRATRRTRAGRDPSRARARKWTLFCIYLSIGILLALAAVFTADSGGAPDQRLLVIGGAAAAVFFVALRFRKAVGIPVLVLLAVAGVTVSLFLRSITAFTGETEIAAVRVLSSNRDSMRLELIPKAEQPVLLTMEGEYFAPIVKVVIFDDLLVFLGAKTWYRFEGMTSFKLVKEGDGYGFRQGSTDFYFPTPTGISETVWSFFEKHETRIPGVKTVQVEMDLKRADSQAREFATYGIVVRNNGGVEIVPRS